MTNEENPYNYIFSKINDEGLGYYIQHYTDGEELPTPAKQLFQIAQRALNLFEDSLDDYPDIQNRVDNEGLGYYLMHYTDSDSMPTPFLKNLFNLASTSLLTFESFVEDMKDDS